MYYENIDFRLYIEADGPRLFVLVILHAFVLGNSQSSSPECQQVTLKILFQTS